MLPFPESVRGKFKGFVHFSVVTDYLRPDHLQWTEDWWASSLSMALTKSNLGEEKRFILAYNSRSHPITEGSHDQHLRQACLLYRTELGLHPRSRAGHSGWCLLPSLQVSLYSANFLTVQNHLPMDDSPHTVAWGRWLKYGWESLRKVFLVEQKKKIFCKGSGIKSGMAHTNSKWQICDAIYLKCI